MSPKKRTRLEWWLPLLPFFTPGICYAYAAVFPNFRVDFAIAGGLLTLATAMLMLWRRLRPEQTETHLFRLIAIQGFTLALLLIAYRFWLASLAMSPIVIGLALLSVYIIAFFVPSTAPSFAERFYREVWLPKNPLVRALAATALALGGGAGYVGADLGMRASRILGDRLFPIMAVFTTLALFFMNLYVSIGLLKQKRGENPIPSPEK